ncbi:reticulon-4 receptor-like 2 [Branchiostoma lanceolatum]|uniref:reticulon-4 receptor-like 2 n=1 Tax=Branchiostoma lanceolatum TaxID=7740 RepID=UPI00345617D1
MDDKLPGMLLSLLVILKVSGGTTEASCRFSGSQADCSGGVPRNLPAGITSLSLASYPLSNLSADTFTALGNLTVINLTNSEIRDIETGTFNSTPKLRALYLNQNKLTILRSGMFTGLGNLREISLDYNEISDIQAGTVNPTPQLVHLSLAHNKLTNLRSDMFTGLGNLASLYLDNNEITEIQPGTFNPTPELATLHLQQNKLTALKAEVFAKLPSNFTLNLARNPWQCDCRMVPFRQTMTVSRPFANQITCEGPRNFRGKRLKDIRPDDLMSSCKESQSNEPANVHFGYTGSWTSQLFSLPVLVGSGCACATVLLVAIFLTLWRKRRSKNRPKSPNARVVFNNTNPTATVTVSANFQAGHGRLGADEEYDYIATPSRKPLTCSGQREHLGGFEDEYEVIPPSLPPRNVSGLPAGDQNGSVAAQRYSDTPQGVMDEDEYESVKDDSQSNEYQNSHVRAAAKDTETVVQVIMGADDYLSFVVTEKRPTTAQ